MDVKLILMLLKNKHYAVEPDSQPDAGQDRERTSKDLTLLQFLIFSKNGDPKNT